MYSARLSTNVAELTDCTMASCYASGQEYAFGVAFLINICQRDVFAILRLLHCKLTNSTAIRRSAVAPLPAVLITDPSLADGGAFCTKLQVDKAEAQIDVVACTISFCYALTPAVMNSGNASVIPRGGFAFIESSRGARVVTDFSRCNISSCSARHGGLA